MPELTNSEINSPGALIDDSQKLCVTLKPTAHLAHLVFADTKANPKKTKRAKSPTADKRLVGNFI